MSSNLNRKKKNVELEIKKKRNTRDYQGTSSLGQCITLSSLWNPSESVVTRRKFRKTESVSNENPFVLDSHGISIFVHFGALITRCKRFQ